LQSLIALGLVLFLLTFILNGLARLLIVVTTQKGSEVADDKRQAALAKIRKQLHAGDDRRVRFCLGSGSLLHPRLPGVYAHFDQLDFFTKLPKPVGEAGGGMANAIVGSGKILLLASLMGCLSVPGRVYLAEFSGKGMASVVRYAADLLNGGPPS